MSVTRDGFHSRIGFVLAAAGSAIGLGNIWGFPTQAANNGGGAFLLVYLLVTLLLALPALYAEIYIGNHAQKNPVKALTEACSNLPKIGKSAGIIGLCGAIMMLSFYSIVAGWMLSHALSAIAELMSFNDAANWFANDSLSRNLAFTPVFILLGAAIIHRGVHAGIERWSSRLMPLLLMMLVGLIVYILGQPGAEKGLDMYLKPDFSQLSDPKLIISAMGQAFFSLSLGVGGMMVYGSYLKKGDNMGKLVVSIASLDSLIAFLAGLLIIPALFVAQEAGFSVFIGDKLIGEGQLIFHILPSLFNSMGEVGSYVALAFFTLMSIAALTSTISSIEVPVSYLVEDCALKRTQATWLVSAVVFVASITIVFNFDWLFGAIIYWVNTFQLPLMGLFYFIVVGWLWHRGNALSLKTSPESTFIKWWGNYLRFVCPALLTLVFINLAFG